MRYRQSLVSLSVLSLVVCFALSGCQPSYPYYTNEGNMESREVHVHVAEGKVIEVPCGMGMGAGLTAADKMTPDGGEVVKEKDGVKVTLTPKNSGSIFTVKEVTYNGKKCAAHEPVL